MKTLAVAVSMFVMVPSSFAMPNVGDEALFDYTVTQNGETQTGTLEARLVSFDQTKNQYDETYTITLNGTTQTGDFPMDVTDLLTDAQLADILTHCEAHGGSHESVTVPAGTYDTCAIPYTADNASGTTWYGNAKFGVIQDVDHDTNGETETYKLRSQSSKQR